jgi:hypothetical protein
MRKLRAALTAIAVAGTAGVAVAVGTGIASAATELGVGASLPIGNPGDVVVDTAHQRLLISDVNNGALYQTTYAGAVVAKKTGLPGIEGLTLSRDSQTLYAAVADAHAIVTFDPDTLAETARYAIGAAVYPRTLAVAGGKVWFGYDGSAEKEYVGGFGFFDPSGDLPLTLHDSTADRTAFHDRPALLTAPGAPKKLVVADFSTNAATNGNVAVYDVSGSQEVNEAKGRFNQGVLSGAGLTADGTSLIGLGLRCPAWTTPVASPYTWTKAYDNKLCDPSSVDVNTDGRVAIGYRNDDGGTDVAVYPAGSQSAEQEFTVPSTAPANPTVPDYVEKVFWEPGGNRIFALGHNFDGKWRLWVINGPEQTIPGPQLTLSHNNSVNAYGSTVTVTAHLGTTATNRTVEIWADPYGTEPLKLLRKTVVDAKGNLTASLKLTRTTAVQVKFAGDAKYAPASARSVLNTQVSIALQPSRQYKAAKIGTVPYRYYRKTVHPYFVTTMTAYPARKQRLIFETYSGGAWKATRVLDVPLTSAGTSAFTLTGTHAVGVRYRVRAAYITGTSGDAVNYTTYGSYQYFTFTS